MNPPLHIGFAAFEITPREPCPLLGYTQRADLHGPVHDGILDPLFARVLMIDNGSLPVVLISCDLCLLENPAVHVLRQQIATQIGSSPERVILAATHTHSGPYAWSKDWPEGPREYTPDVLRGPSSETYWQQLQSDLALAVARAMEDRAPARLRTRESSLGFAYNRRIVDPNGVHMCWNPKEQPALCPQAADDPALVLLEIERDSKPTLLLYNLAGHPVVLGKESNLISADWPGAVNRQFEILRPDTRVCFFHGAGADAHPWLATDQNPRDLETVAAPVTGLITLLHASGGNASEDTRITVKEVVVSLRNRDLRLSALRLGPLRLLIFPGELFGKSGLRLRQKISGPLFVVTTANGWSGYWPPLEAFDQGGYELDAVRAFGIEAGDTERVLDAAENLLQQICIL